MLESGDILYSYKREDSNSITVLTSAGTEDSFREQCSSVTMFHRDCHWLIESGSKKTKYVIDNLRIPSFDEIRFAANYSVKRDVDTCQLKDFLEEISDKTEELEPHIQLQSALLRYRHRQFYVENCYGDCVSVEYPLIGLEVYLGGNMLHHISYGGSFHFPVFRDQFLSFFSEECAQVKQLDMLESQSLEDFKVSSVALSGYSMGTLLHESVGHLLEYDHARSLTIHRGDNYTTPAVVVSETPKKTSSFGFCPCSDEGLELHETTLLKSGTIQEFLTSLSLSEPPYRHGRAQRCTDLPLPRNTNLSMEKGKEREDIIFQYPCTLYIHKKINPVLQKVENGIPFYDVEIPTAYIVRNGEFEKMVHNIHVNIGFDHFFDNADIMSTVRGNQVGYCIKSQQQVESTQVAPGILIPADSIRIYECG